MTFSMRRNGSRERNRVLQRRDIKTSLKERKMTIDETQIVDWTFAGRLNRSSDDKTDSKRRTKMTNRESRDLDYKNRSITIVTG